MVQYHVATRIYLLHENYEQKRKRVSKSFLDNLFSAHYYVIHHFYHSVAAALARVKVKY